MELRVLLNNEVLEIENMPTFSFTLDDTNDNAKIVSKATNQREPYKADSVVKLQIKEDNGNWNTIQTFYLALDEVKLFSNNPILYTHNLTLTQNIRKLAKYIVRNTVFSQTRDTEAYYSITNLSNMILSNVGDGSSAVGVYLKTHEYYAKKRNDDEEKDNNWKESLHLSIGEIITFLKLKVDLFCIRSNDFDYSVEGDQYANGYFDDWSGYSADFLKDKIIINVNITRSDGQTLTLPLNYEAPTTFKRTNNILDITFKEVSDSVGGTLLQRILDFKGNYAIDIDIELEDNVFLKPIDTSNTPAFDNFFKNNNASATLHLTLQCGNRRLTMYHVIDTLIKQCRKQRDWAYIDNICSLPTSGEFYDLLNNTLAPTVLSFTQSTLFDALKECYKIWDAIPTLDENDVLGIEYFNERKKEINDKFVGVKSTLKEDNFNDAYISKYQNALIKKSFPGNNAFTRVRTNVLGVPNKEDFVFYTDGIINYLDKAYVLCSDFTYLNSALYAASAKSYNFYFVISKAPIDISHYIVEESLWSLLDSEPNQGAFEENNTQKLFQQNTLRYKKGTNQINLSNYYTGFIGNQFTIFGNAIRGSVYRFMGYNYSISSLYVLGQNGKLTPTGGQWEQILMRVEYYQRADGLVSVESLTNKYKGQTLISQNSGNVDINKIGLNMLGLIIKNGEPILVANQTISNWEDRVEKGDIYIDENLNQYVANIVTYTFINDKIQTTIEFSKNFNALSQRVKVDVQKRLSNISEDLSVVCEDVIKDYFYISASEDINKNSDPYPYMSNLVTMLAHTFGARSDIKKSIDFAKLSYTRIINRTDNLCANVFIPLRKYASGNAICFETSFDNAISAGNALIYTPNGNIWGDNWFSQVVKYADDEGNADVFTINYMFDNRDGDEQVFDFGFPQLEYEGSIQFALQNYEFYKKPNEIFALNYEFVFLPLPNRENIDFIGQQFLLNNGLLFDQANDDKFYIYYSTSEAYNFLDKVGVGDKVPILSCDYQQLHTFIFNLTQENYNILSNTNIKSFAICDSKGNIYFASNSKPSLINENGNYQLNLYCWYKTIRFE